MKNRILSSACLIMAVVSVLSLGSCKQEEIQHSDPIIKLETSHLEVPAEGGAFFIVYSLENPIKGEQVAARCPDEWVSGFDYAAKGRIGFKVSENTTGISRKTQISVLYPQNPQLQFEVVQTCAEPEKEPDFTVTVSNVSFQTAHVRVEPKDGEMEYFMFIGSRQHFDDNGLTEDDEAVFQDDLNFLKEDAEKYGDTMENTYGYYVNKGIMENDLGGYTPGTGYVAYAYGVKLDGGTIQRLTDVTRTYFKTKNVPQLQVDFDIQVQVSGANAKVSVQPDGYEGAYYVGVFPDVVQDDEARQLISEQWTRETTLLQMSGYSAAEIVDELCQRGKSEQNFELQASQQYMACAIAISPEAIICSEASGKTFETGSVAPSDNVISIYIDNIKARQADLTIQTTNEDPYSPVLYRASSIQGLSDEEIIRKCIENVDADPVKGGFTKTVEGLEPETTYAVLCFGKEGGQPTTGLFRRNFTTAASEVGKATISAQFEKYYDIKAIGEIKPDYLGYLDYGDCFLPVTVTTDPSDAEEYYFGVIPIGFYESMGMPIDDDFIVDQFLREGPAPLKTQSFPVVYGEESVVAAMVKDTDGNFSALWKSERFVLTADGASDPQEFVDRYGAPARRMSLR